MNKEKTMKRVLSVIGVGAFALVFMSSTCSTQEGSATAATSEDLASESTTAPAKAGNGIDFKKYNLEKAKEQAASEGKLIFIDAYTSWCGPCKKMAATTFMDDEVAAFFNENFINIKIEMEKDADGPAAARRYNVRAYPTLLIVDEEGNLVKQTIGFKTKDQLMNFAEGALN